MKHPGHTYGGFVPTIREQGTTGAHTHFELRHLYDPRFLRRGSRSTQPNDEVERIVKTSSSRMVKYWITKICLTNPSTEPSTPSHPM
jgi:hypothetical protein